MGGISDRELNSLSPTKWILHFSTLVAHPFQKRTIGLRKLSHLLWFRFIVRVFRLGCMGRLVSFGGNLSLQKYGHSRACLLRETISLLLCENLIFYFFAALSFTP